MFFTVKNVCTVNVKERFYMNEVNGNGNFDNYNMLNARMVYGIATPSDGANAQPTEAMMVYGICTPKEDTVELQQQQAPKPTLGERIKNFFSGIFKHEK